MQASLETEIVRSYKRLAYTHWHALAEFVDNSTQAYFNNRELLRSTDPSFRLKVQIIYNREDNTLVILDNSIGMNEAELDRAMRIGMPPDDATGRSRYGLGMKTAACWFGNVWSLTTKKLDDQNQYSITFDVNRIASGDRDLRLAPEPKPAKDHYTVITISDLNKQFVGRTITKVKEYLRSFYRKDIEQFLDLYWGEERLTWDTAQIERDLLMNDETPYSIDFDFTINGKRIRGWAGVFRKGGRSKAGFSILHNDRVIQGWPDAYRPINIFGENSNDLVNQRLVGELDLGAFEISHTKDQILYADNEQDELEDELKEKLSDLIIVARDYRKKDAVRPINLNNYIGTLESRFSDDLRSPMAQQVEESSDTDQNLQVVSETNTALAQHIAEGDGRANQDVTVSGLNVKLFISSEINETEQYVLHFAKKQDEQQLLSIIINTNHPYYSSITNESELVTFFRNSIFDAFCVWDICKNETDLVRAKLERFVYLKDILLRTPLDFNGESISAFLSRYHEDDGEE